MAAKQNRRARAALAGRGQRSRKTAKPRRLRWISLAALALLTLLFVARRMGLGAHRGRAELTSPQNQTEQLSPRDRARLDQLIRDKSRP